MTKTGSLWQPRSAQLRAALSSALSTTMLKGISLKVRALLELQKNYLIARFFLSHFNISSTGNFKLTNAISPSDPAGKPSSILEMVNAKSRKNV